MSSSDPDAAASPGRLQSLPYIAAIVPLLAFVAFSAWAYTSVRHEARLRMSRTLDLVQEHASKVFDTYTILLSAADKLTEGLSDEQIAANEQDLHTALTRLVSGLPQVQAVWVLGADGRALATTLVYPVPKDVFATDREFFRVHRDRPDQGTYVSEVLTGRVKAIPYFQLTRRRNGRDGSFQGIIAVSVEPRYFADFYKHVSAVGLSSAGLQRLDGAVLARFPETPTVVGPLGPETPFAQAIKANAERGSYQITSPYDGRERILDYSRVSGQPLYVSVGLDTWAVTSAWLRLITGPALLAVAIAAILFWLVQTAVQRAQREAVALAGLKDETARRQVAEAEQRRADALYRAHYRNTTESLFVVGVGPDGTFRFEEANPAHDKATGRRSEENRGKTLDELAPPELADKFRENYLRCVSSRLPIQYEEELDFGQGLRRWETSLAPVFDPNGVITHLVGSSRDITERVELQDRLRRSERLEALAGLTAGVAHDFNNLLMVLLGSLDLLKRAKEDRRERYINTALQAIEQGRRLTDQLLMFGRRKPRSEEVVDLAQVVVQSEGLVTQALRGNVRFVHDLAESLWPVKIDVAQFQAAMINLATNAKDAMPSGGEFTVRAVNASIQRDGTRTEGVSLTFADTGTGMPKAVLARAFEPFFTTKEVGRGTGLGLAQVYGFARQSLGTVDIQSEEGKGTSITLFLPRSDRESSLQPVAEPATPSSRRGSLRILLVEDNAQVAEVASDVLNAAGHSIVHARNGQEARDMLRRDRFDLVFSDMVMPGAVSGLDLAKHIRATAPDLPVILTTGYSDAAVDVQREGIQLIWKPYDPAKLVEILEAAASPHPANLVYLSRKDGERGTGSV